MARAERRQRRVSEPFRQQPWRQPVNTYAPTEVLTADQVEEVHQAALTILRDTGLRVLSPAARRKYREAGAEVDEDSLNVRFDPGLVDEMLARAPATMTIQARNPAYDLTIGGDCL